ncbi:MAG: TIGR04211 family SH3 domain-containing protein [Candidatus Thiodiazotropha sp.]
MKKYALLLICSILLLPQLTQAETRYVTDVFKITMRSGESTSHKIIRMLDSGMPLQVLSTNPGNGYSKVRAGSTEGYVLTRQLMNKPSARSQLASLEKEIEALKAAPGELRTNLANLQKEHRELTQAYKELQTIKNKQEQELQSIQRTASNAIRISNERNELRKQVADLTREAEDLKQENRDLSNEATRDWFLIGAGVIIAGILIGLILPHLRFQRRRNSWGSL